MRVSQFEVTYKEFHQTNMLPGLFNRLHFFLQVILLSSMSFGASAREATNNHNTTNWILKTQMIGKSFRKNYNGNFKQFLVECIDEIETQSGKSRYDQLYMRPNNSKNY
jgi:hypothetical protein